MISYFNKYLHDAELYSIDINRKNSILKLKFELNHDKHIIISLKGVLTFRCEDLTCQNVVSRLMQSSMYNFNSEDLVYWIKWASSLSDAEMWTSQEIRNKWLADIKNEILELIVLEPSAGAQFAAICKKSEIITDLSLEN